MIRLLQKKQLRGDARSANQRTRGSLLMETVLALPIILMLICGIAQFSRFWQARLFTWYAAYNAARAALVYHYGEYGEESNNALVFFEKKGVVWLSAVSSLSWMSHTLDDQSFVIPGYGAVAHSSGIADQVRIVSSKSWESNGMVRVTVEFKFPTIFHLFDFNDVFENPDVAGTSEQTAWDLLNPPPPTGATGTLDLPTFTLTETCILPKPWGTANFPRVTPSEMDRLHSLTP